MYTTNPPPKAFSAIAAILPHHIPIVFCSRDKLTLLAGADDHQGIVAAASPIPTRKKCFSPAQHPFIILLDGIQDPRNLGAIIRSASCTNVSGVIVPQKHTAPFTGVVCKASAGLIEHMDIYQPPSSSAALQEIGAAGYHIYLATIAGTDVRTISFTTPLCLVIGSEGSGIAPHLRACGTAITIPQRTTTISYNASVAAGILLFNISTALKHI